MTIQDARKRVARGTAVLDREYPGWASHIDVGALDCPTYDVCILGQLYRSYARGAMRLFPDGPNGWSYWSVRTHGFYTAESYEQLQNAWIEAIADRVVTPEPVTAALVGVGV